MYFLKLYGIALPLFFLIDILWIGLVAHAMYREEIGFLMASQARWGAVILFYLIYAVGVVHFAIAPALATEEVVRALFNGALLGLVCYATYDMTNLAILKGWSVKISLYDVLWGVFLTSSVAGITYWIAMHWRESFLP